MSPALHSRSLPNPDDAIPAVSGETTPLATSWKSGKRPRTRGQSMVEFALLLPILILILALSADFGRAFTAYIAISGAAGSGASYAMQNTAQSQDTAKIQQIALANAPSIWGVTPTVSSTTTCTPPDPQGYKCVRVTVRYTFRPIIEVPPIKGPYTLMRSVQMRVIG